MLDAKLVGLTSEISLDISKAFFIATIVTPSLTNTTSIFLIIGILLKGTASGIFFLYLSWQLAKWEETLCKK